MPAAADLTGRLRIWVDLANSPQVLFFRPLIPRWEALGHTVVVTSRPYAQTGALADQLALPHTPIGRHDGRSVRRLGSALVQRARALIRWGRRQAFDLAVSHNSYAQILAARWLGVPAVTSMDYEYQAANHLAFRLARRIVVPQSFPERLLRLCGAGRRWRRYGGLKEQVYLAGFRPDPEFRVRHGLRPDAVLAVVRPAAEWALYHRFANPLPELLLRRLAGLPELEVVFLPRLPEQRRMVEQFGGAGIRIPEGVWNGPELLAAADVVFSAGGTMAREAAVLGTPAYTLFAGRRPAVDDYLVRLGRLTILRTPADIEQLTPGRRPPVEPLLRGTDALLDELSQLLLDVA